MTVYATVPVRVINVRDLSQVGEARRAAADMATDLGFSATRQGSLAIVVTEAATNLAQHAQKGKLLLQALRLEETDMIEVIAIDHGPGMANVRQCLEDGYSTAGTRGQGLGAIARLSDLFDIYSMPGIGTAMFAGICSQPGPAKSCGTMPASSLVVGAINMAKPGEQYSGDSWAVISGPSRSLVMVVDGLGHGPQASEAAVEARRVFLANGSRELLSILELAHGALRKTRGAAMAISEVRTDQRLARFAGVGNISGSVWSAGDSRSMVSHNGIVGHEIRKMQEFSYPFPQGSLLMMCSDGLVSHCDCSAYPGMLIRYPVLLAAMLWRDCVRGTDDATILVAREP